jgi:sodium/pantothenate symporter
MLAAVSPPKFLQSIIVFTGSGLSTSFLVPIGLGLYWPRFNRSGAVAGMLGGFISYTLLYAVGFAQSYQAGVELTPIEPGGFHPFLVGCLVSLVCAIVATLSTAPPPQHLLRKYFLAQQDTKND